LALISVVIALGVPLLSGTMATRAVTLASVLVLCASWIYGYVRQCAPLATDLADSVAILAFALASPHPSGTVLFVFPALWFRSLYGSGQRAVLRCAMYAGALCASVALWTYVPGHTQGAGTGQLLGAVPTMFLTVLVGRHLAAILRERGQAARRDAVYAAVGSQLLGVTDAAEIRRIAWVAIATICAVTPGLRVLKVVRQRTGLRVESASGGFARLPAKLPGNTLSRADGDRGKGGETVQDASELDAAVGTQCDWASVPLPSVPNQPEVAWLLLGSPNKLPAEAVSSIASLANQVTLALRNSAVHQELTVQATLDSLTGLANRASFHTALAGALGDEVTGVDGSPRPTTVLFIDLDDFKDVNDAFGHGAGDQLLRLLATRLRRATRPEDLCARLGGDEFAVLLRGTGNAAAGEIARRIVQAVSTPAHIGGGVARVGASVGVATASGETDIEHLIHRADVAMYAAKANGKARVQVFEPSLLEVDSSRVAFERQLAAAARNDELVVHYQPVLSLPDGRCIAVEALVRWQRPDAEMQYPDTFIEAAERIGAIHDIGAFVLRQSCADAASWRAADPSCALAVHVNISALQLDDDAFFASVTDCLTDFGLPAEQLVLEITETVMISSAAAIDQLNALAAYGVTIAIDDFGTGYSALTTLRSLPVRIVKIDKSFVAGSTTNPEDRAVTEAVVKMATQMGMRTIAEGVERLDQQIFLEAIHADAVQGDLYLQPATAEELHAWLGEHLAGLPQPLPHSDVVIAFTPRQTA